MDSTTLLDAISVAAGAHTRINELFDAHSPSSAYGRRASTTTGLTWGYYGTRWGGSAVANGTVELTASNTNYIVAHRTTGAVTVSTATTNWDDSGTYARLYKVVAGTATVTSYEDHRVGPSGLIGAASGVTAADVTIADSGAYYAGTTAEAALQEVGAALAASAKVPASRYTIDTDSTADSDPGAGLLKFDNATPSSATFIYIDDSTSDSVDLSTYFAALGATGFVRIQSVGDADEWMIFKWTAVTDGTGYFKLAVTHQASKGTLDDADAVLVTFDSDAASASGTTGKHAIYIAAGSMRPSSSGGCAALATLNIAAGQPDIHTLDFDASTEEYAQFSVTMPKSWNEGTVTFAPVWSHAATATNFGVSWGLQGVAISNDDAMAAAFGTAQTSIDTGGTTNDLYVGPESSAITIAGTPAAEDAVFFRIYRDADDGTNDTMTIDARLHGIVLYITTDAENDA